MDEKLRHFEVILGSMEKIQKELDELKGWINCQIFETKHLRQGQGPVASAVAGGDQNQDQISQDRDEPSSSSSVQVSFSDPSELVQIVKDEIIDEENYGPEVEIDTCGNFDHFNHEIFSTTTTTNRTEFNDQDQDSKVYLHGHLFDPQHGQGQGPSMIKTPNKRICLNLEEKVDIIQQIEQSGGQLREVSRRLNKPRSTLHSIWRQKDKILHSYQRSNTKNKKMRKCEFAQVDDALYDWFIDQKTQNGDESISGNLILAKAVELADFFKCDKFKASRGWLERWKLRHNIRFKKDGNSSGHQGDIDMDMDDSISGEPISSQSQQDQLKFLSSFKSELVEEQN